MYSWERQADGFQENDEKHKRLDFGCFGATKK